MDLSNYSNFKQLGTVTVTLNTDDQTNSTYTITQNQYDTNTGQLIGTDSRNYSQDDINSMIAGLQSKIDSLNALLTDIQAVSISVTEPPTPEPPQSL